MASPTCITGPLVDGTNVLTIQLFNANYSSSDLVIDASLVGTVDDVVPTLTGQAPAPGTTNRELKPDALEKGHLLEELPADLPAPE